MFFNRMNFKIQDVTMTSQRSSYRDHVNRLRKDSFKQYLILTFALRASDAHLESLRC